MNAIPQNKRLFIRQHNEVPKCTYGIITQFFCLPHSPRSSPSVCSQLAIAHHTFEKSQMT